MLFNKTVRIALVNWKTFLKSLLFQALSLALLVALMTFAFGSLAQEVLTAFRSTGADETISHILQSLLDGTFNADHFINEDMKTLIVNIKQSLESVSNVWNRVEVSVIVCAVAFLFYRFLVSCTDITVGYQIDEFMSSNSARPFTWFLFKKAGRSIRFVGLQMLLAIILDALIFSSGMAMAVICMAVFGLWAIIPVLLFSIVLYAMRHSFMAFCLPSVVYNDTQRVSTAFRKGITESINNFGKILGRTLLIILLMVVTTALSYLFNQNRFIVLTVSALINFVLFYIIKCLNFVLYYESNNYPYFFRPILLEGTEQHNRKIKKKN